MVDQKTKEESVAGVQGALAPAEAPFGASIPAEAGTHEWRNVVEARTSEPLPSSTLMCPKRGNPTIQIPPLYYAPHEQNGWIYIVANKPNGIIYVGQTTNLLQRIQGHKDGKNPGFSKTHGCKTLVYFEGYAKITESIERESTMKEWPRSWKIRRILATNPEWRDLHAEICL